MSLQLTCDEVRLRLVTEGRIPEGPVGASPPAVETPWFMRILIGFGAWVSVCFGIGFLASISLLNQAGARVVLGAILFVGAVVLRRRRDSDFTNQVALVTSILGQGLLVSGLVEFVDKVPVTCATICVLSVATLIFFPDAVHHFVSTLAFFISATLCFGDMKVPGALDLMMVLSAAATAVLWLGMDRMPRLRGRKWVRPAAFGAAVFLAGLVVGILASDAELRSGGSSPFIPHFPWVLVPVLTLWLGAVEAAAFRELGLSLRTPRFALMVGLSLALSVVTHAVPGIAVAVGLGLLAVLRRAPVLAGLAVVSLIGFGGFFYYDLDTTLLAKSGMLVGSGVVVLGAAYFLREAKRVP